MTIKEWRKRLGQLDVVDLGEQKFLWLCPKCHKQMIINYEQVSYMIHNSDDMIVCEECSKLALFVVKRNAKYLSLIKNDDNTISKRWPMTISNASVFTKEEIDKMNLDSSFQILPISDIAKRLKGGNK